MRRLAAYLKEREGFDSILRDEGFISYRIQGDECLIYDIFVSLDYRKKRIATELAEQVEKIAINSGCKYLSGTVIPTAKNSTESARFILSYGMKIHAAIPNAIVFRKDL